MFKKLAVVGQLLSLGLILSGCSYLNSQVHEDTLNTWIGQPVEHLVEVWGAPDSTFTMNEKTYYTYIDSYGSVGSVMPIGYARIVRTREKSCKTTFVIYQGEVGTWRYEGNACR